MFIGKGEWKSSIPNEIELIMQDDKHDWDWQVREISGIEWFVARIGTKTIAGMIAAPVESPHIIPLPDEDTDDTE